MRAAPLPFLWSAAWLLLAAWVSRNLPGKAPELRNKEQPLTGHEHTAGRKREACELRAILRALGRQHPASTRLLSAIDKIEWEVDGDLFEE